MAKLGETFDRNTVPADEFEPLPAGDYFAQVTESEMRPTKAGTGEYLKLTWQVLAGPFEGRKFWEQLNIRNPNDTAQRIALQSLAKICDAMGLAAIDDSDELHNRPVNVRLVVKEQAGYSPKNEVKGYSAHEPSKPAASKPAAAATKPAAPRPWGARATA